MAIDLRIELKGTEAAQALRTIDAQEGRIISVLPLEQGEVIFYEMPRGRRASIGTNPIPSFCALGCTLGEAIDQHLRAMSLAGCQPGYAVDNLIKPMFVADGH